MTTSGGAKADAVSGQEPGQNGQGTGGVQTQLPDPRQEVLEHLLFHKALADHDPERLQAYLEMAKEDVQSFRDPFDQAIATAFHLAMDEHLDPWSIDLIKFSRTYMERLDEHAEVDLITSGRLLAMAWQVLLFQTEDVLARAQPKEEEPAGDPWDLPWEEFPDEWGDYDADPDVKYNDKVLHDPEPPITESVFRQGERRVTLFELVEALEEAREDASRRMQLAKERRKAKQAAKEEGEENVKKIHKEDLEAEIADVRRRIAALPGQHTLTAIHDGTREDFLTCFISSLFLHRANMAEVTQENFPYGPILVEPLDPIHDPEAPLVGLPTKGALAGKAEASEEAPADEGASSEADAPSEEAASEEAAAPTAEVS